MSSASDAPVRNRTRVGDGGSPRCGGGSSESPAASDAAPAVIQLDGSSTVFPISEAVAEEFQKANPGIRVTVGISGTGGGFQKFCRGETDISDASRPISADRDRGLQEGRHRVHRAADRLRRPGDRRESEEHLGDDDHGRRAEDAVGARGAGQGHALEPGARRRGRTARSTCSAPASIPAPTTTSPKRSSARQGASRGDFTSSEDDNVLVQGVSSDELALGFLPLAYVEQNQRQAEARAGRRRQGGQRRRARSRRPPRRCANGTYQPLSRPLFIYVARKAADRPEVQKFVDVVLRAAGRWCAKSATSR